MVQVEILFPVLCSALSYEVLGAAKPLTSGFVRTKTLLAKITPYLWGWLPPRLGGSCF